MRSHNEDSYLDDSEKRLWAVADGMGGHEAGDIASQAIVRHLREVVPAPNPADLADRVEDALTAVNAELIEYAQTHRLQMVGSTAAVLADAGHYMLCGWAGDSRIYRLSSGGIQQLTTDHNQAREMLSTGQFSAADLQSNAHAGALVRAVGAEPNLVVEWAVSDAAPEDVFLLCSDGITKEMSDSEIADALGRSKRVKEIGDALVDTCLARGARDNITVVVVRVES